MNLIVFDVDGTMLNTTGVDDDCYEKAIWNVHSIKIDEIDWSKFKDVTDQGVTEDILTSHSTSIVVGVSITCFFFWQTMC